MKKKILAIFLAVASVVVCAVCAVACGGVSNKDLVGKYEFVSLGLVPKEVLEELREDDGDEFDEQMGDVVAGENGITADYFVFELKSDGTLIMDGRDEGTWSVQNGNLVFSFEGEEDRVFEETFLDGDILSFKISGYWWGIVDSRLKVEIKMKKVA